MTVDNILIAIIHMLVSIIIVLVAIIMILCIALIVTTDQEIKQNKKTHL